MFLGQNYIYFIEKTDKFILHDVPFYIVFGVLAGLLSVYFSKSYLSSNRFFAKIKSKWKKYLLGSSVLGLLIFLFPSLYGEGYEVVNQALKGDTQFLFDNSLYPNFDGFLGVSVLLGLILLLKVFATSATFGAGGVGGIFAPALFLGANLGLFFSRIVNSLGFNISSTNFALVGMAGVMGGIVHAPLTAIFLIAEITGGYGLFIPLMIVSAISYFTARAFMPNSVYTILLAKKGQLLTHNADTNMLALLRMEGMIEKNFLCLKDDANLGDLVEGIKHSNRNIFVVIDDENTLKGVVLLDHVRHIMFNKELYQQIKIVDLMYMPSPIIEKGMNMKQIAELFEKSEHYNLPVVCDGKYLGFISRAKVFSKYRKMLKKLSND